MEKRTIVIWTTCTFFILLFCVIYPSYLSTSAIERLDIENFDGGYDFLLDKLYVVNNKTTIEISLGGIEKEINKSEIKENYVKYAIKNNIIPEVKNIRSIDHELCHRNQFRRAFLDNVSIEKIKNKNLFVFEMECYSKDFINAFYYLFVKPKELEKEVWHIAYIISLDQ